MKERFQLIGDIASVATIPALVFFWWLITGAIHTSRLETESAAKDIYVQKTDFAAAVVKLVEADKFLSEAQKELALTVQSDHTDIQVLKIETKKN